jgi:formamidopyrimidine-DNA glycosylase
MPELPEVETIAVGLRAVLTGRVIAGAEVYWERSLEPPDSHNFKQRVIHQTIVDVTRRGKWLVLELDCEDTLLVHLRMSGQLRLDPPRAETRHLRVLFTLDNGQQLGFFDQRKFGRLHLTSNVCEVLGVLGPEPLSDEFTVARFGDMLVQRRGRVKPLLLNQRFLAGLGNIYVDEALWQARIHPMRAANSLSAGEVQFLHRSIQSVLKAAIGQGGTTLTDSGFRRPDGRAGEFARRLAVYGRGGQPCLRCDAVIERIRVSQRGTHLCPRCQLLA